MGGPLKLDGGERRVREGVCPRYGELRATPDLAATGTKTGPFAELLARSNGSFLEGASHPDEMVARAKELGLGALGIADTDGVYGMVKAHQAAKEAGVKLIAGARLTVRGAPVTAAGALAGLGAGAFPAQAPRGMKEPRLEGTSLAAPLALLARDLAGWSAICGLVTKGRMRLPKGASTLSLEEIAASDAPVCCFAIARPADVREAARLKEIFGERLSIAVSRHHAAGDARAVARAVALARETGVPLVATNEPYFHVRERKALHDVLLAIREKRTVAELGRIALPNAEWCLKGPAEMARLFADLPEALARSVEIADACSFSIDELRYRYPHEWLPEGHTPMTWLRALCSEGLAWRYPAGAPSEPQWDLAGRAVANAAPEEVTRQLAHELTLIEALDFAPYFLTVWDIVRWARDQKILCQGRGSAANSVVCWLLGITSIDPVRMSLLFERFVSVERGEPPDIDVDFEHERREEVIQHVYEKYGRHRAGMVANLVTYRHKSAVREVGKALGLSLEQVDRLSRAAGERDLLYWGGNPRPSSNEHDGYRPEEHETKEGAAEHFLREAGFDPREPVIRQVLARTRELLGFPRHLGIHSGGFAITAGPLHDLVPTENATMPGRTVVEWDKDDLAGAGILKIDVLALGMLTMIRKALDLVRAHDGISLTLATIPPEDPATYDMICDADTVGVFQIESRAQMNMLPRFRPRCFYDLVIEIALIRPGPITGGMIPPLLKRRWGMEATTFPHPCLEPILAKTYGVPVFQEQAIKVAVAAAGFAPGEADELRRSMTHKRSVERLAKLHERLLSGMAERGIARPDAEEIVSQLSGFAGYGFPESHSASFALLVYASSWLKRHHHAAFSAALLNSLPMGFYAAHTIVDDAKRHGVDVRGLDVTASRWDCTLEPRGPTSHAFRAAPSSSPTAEAGKRVNAPAPPPAPAAAAADRRGRGLAAWRAMTEGDAQDRWPVPGPEHEAERARPTTESAPWGDHHAIRIGYRFVRGLSERWKQRLEETAPFVSWEDMVARARLPRDAMARIAAADGFRALGLSRREALWMALRMPPTEHEIFRDGGHAEEPGQVAFPGMSAREQVLADYHALGLSATTHPVAFFRESFERGRVLSSRGLQAKRNGAHVRVGGMAIVRQRPPTAGNVVFMTLEDEHGFSNLVIPPEVWEAYRPIAREALFLIAEGTVQRAGKAINVQVERFERAVAEDDGGHVRTISTTPEPRVPARDFR